MYYELNQRLDFLLNHGEIDKDTYEELKKKLDKGKIETVLFDIESLERKRILYKPVRKKGNNGKEKA